MEPFLGGTTEMQIELDAGTARHPVGAARHRCSGGGGDRGRGRSAPSCCASCARASSARRSPTPTPTRSVLVIGEPECDPDELSAAVRRARRGARRSRRCLDGPSALGGDGHSADQPTIRTKRAATRATVINALLERAWRIVHIAGHGEPPTPTAADPRGVVLSDDTFLGAARNPAACASCPSWCSSTAATCAARDQRSALTRADVRPRRVCRRRRRGADRHRRALRHRRRLGGGRRRRPARSRRRSTTRCCGGSRFIDAVARGARGGVRRSAATPGRRTSATAIPTGLFRHDGATRSAPTAPLADEFAGIASAAALMLALETLARAKRVQGAVPRDAVGPHPYLTEHFARALGRLRRASPRPSVRPRWGRGI